MVLEHKPTRHVSEHRQDGIRGLYHMTYYTNLEGILRYGLCSHTKAHGEQLVLEDISDRAVNDMRARFCVPDGRRLHDFAALYFNPKNPMMYRRRNIQSLLVVIEFAAELMQHQGVVISDGNAACANTRFYHPNDLHHIDLDTIFGATWCDRPDGKRIRCAEVLYPGHVPPAYIKRIHVREHAMAAYLRKNMNAQVAAKIKVGREVFFS